MSSQAAMDSKPQSSHSHSQSIGSSVDSLTCQWAGCSEKSSSPEALYDHVCERHVGRKSTNNLNLQCQWGSCRITTVKRDHITSHIRVHVPLKPHKCDFCGKTFKRPQDLKKHVKTHADESVLLRSPEPPTNSNSSRSHHNGNDYHHHHSVNLKTGYYPDSSSSYGSSNNSNGSYGYVSSHSSQPVHYGSTTASNGQTYGPIYYTVPQQASYNSGGSNGTATTGSGTGLTESRKREFDAMNDFFGAAKRRQIDSSTYLDLGAQFGSLMQMGQGYVPTLALPTGNAAYGLGSGHMGSGMMQDDSHLSSGGQAAAYAQHSTGYFNPQYSMATAFPELRTKQDLESVDNFLQQLQGTIYENSDFMHQPGPRHVSPTPDSASSIDATTPSAHSNVPGLEDVPSLTPSTYNPSQSPSVGSASAYSQTPPISRPMGTNLYPHLPLVSSGSGGFVQSSMGGTPPSSLGPSYDEDHHRRFSSFNLQRAAPGPMSPPIARASAAPVKGLSTSPKQQQQQQQHPRLPGVASITSRRSSCSSGSVSGASENSADERAEAHINNMRMIEAMREYITKRLERGEFDNRSGSSHKQQQQQQQQQHGGDVEMTDRDAASPMSVKKEEMKANAGQLYPSLRAVV